MGKLRAILFLLVLASIVPLVSAEIFLDQPSSVYNLGDEMIISASVDKISDSYFTLDMVCSNGKITIVRDILSSTIIKKTLPLTKPFINDLLGECYLVASYDSAVSQSQAFTISDMIDAFVTLNKKDVNPGEVVVISIDAKKANGKPLNGFASITFDEAGISLNIPVTNGKLEYNFTLPSSLAAGTYSIKTDVYDKYKDQVTNDVKLESNIVIKQDPRIIEISIEDQEAKPGSDYKFRIIVFDQTNQSISAQARYSLLDGKDVKINDQVVSSDSDIILSLPRNETPGYRTIEARINDLSTKRYFYVPEVEKVSFEIVNTTLEITNIGNVPYRKNIEIGIGQDKEVVDLKLAVGESSSFNLQAPEGTYDVAVTDGVEKFNAVGLSLTGNAVRVVDLSKDASILTRYSLVWLFILGVLGLFIYGVSKGLGKQKFMSYMPNLSRVFRREKYGNVSSIAPTVSTIKSSDIKSLRVTPTEAEHSLVIRGVKESCSIVAVKIKNKSVVSRSDTYKELFSSLSSDIVHSKATLYSVDDFVIGILAPSATRTFKNEVNAVKLAQSLASILSLHNTKFKDKVQFGIGVNCGDLVVEIDKMSKKLKFTSIGNTISLAKRIAESADNELLLSQPLQRKTATSIKAKKVVRGDLDVYQVSSLIDRDENAEFLSRFKERNQYG